MSKLVLCERYYLMITAYWRDHTAIKKQKQQGSTLHDRVFLMAGSSWVFFDGRVFFLVNWVDHSSAVSSPLVSVLGIIDAQASLFLIQFYHLIP